MADYPFYFKCNNNCICCINNTKAFSKRQAPPLEVIEKVIDNLDSSKEHLGIGGGESTMRKEFFHLMRYIKKVHPNMYVFLTTNGRMFYYDEFAKRFADLNLKKYMVGVSLYGHNKKIHESVTRVSGSFYQTVGGIKNMIKYGIPVEVRVIVNKFNYKHLPDVAEFVLKNFPEIHRFVFINMKYTGNALKNKDKIFVKATDVVPYAIRGLKILEDANFEKRLFHFPLCILPEKWREFAKGVTKEQTEELTFVEECKKCKLKDECPRIWKSYVNIAGENEFKALR